MRTLIPVVVLALMWLLKPLGDWLMAPVLMKPRKVEKRTAFEVIFPKPGK